MDKQDYYQILGISKNASDDEIKSAYRKLALQWHPDRNKSTEATQRFKGINAAYEVLSNKEKRMAYDQFGHAAFAQGFPGASPFGPQTRTYRQGPFTYTYTTYGGERGGFEDSGLGGFTDPFEIFEQFFGGASPFGRPQRRKPVYSLTLSFMEAVKGVEKQVKIEDKTHKIKIPAGVEDGNRIRFEDFDLSLRVEPHPTFHREGSDIYVEHAISFPEATLGTVTRVSTIDGPVELRIKPGTQPGTMVRLRGKGVPNVHLRSRGDEYVRIRVAVPEKLSRRARELLEQLEEEL